MSVLRQKRSCAGVRVGAWRVAGLTAAADPSPAGAAGTGGAGPQTEGAGREGRVARGAASKC